MKRSKLTFGSGPSASVDRLAPHRYLVHHLGDAVDEADERLGVGFLLRFLDDAEQRHLSAVHLRGQSMTKAGAGQHSGERSIHRPEFLDMCNSPERNHAFFEATFREQIDLIPPNEENDRRSFDNLT